MMGRIGLMARAWAMIWPASKAFGTATKSHLVWARFAARIDSGTAALPSMNSMPLPRSCSSRCSLSSMTRSGHPLDVLHRRRGCRLGHTRRGQHGRPEPSRIAGATCRATPRPATRRSRATRHRSTTAKNAGLARIEMIAPARIRSRPVCGNTPRSTPRLARMKENSPICAAPPSRDSAQCRSGCSEASARGISLLVESGAHVVLTGRSQGSSWHF